MKQINSKPLPHISSKNIKEVKNILVVDDQKTILNVVNKILKKAGYNVSTAESPELALEIITNDINASIDLVISDIQMPEMNGVELINEIRKIREDIGVLFMSGDTGDVQISSNDILLKKPFRTKLLIQAVKDKLILSPNQYKFDELLEA